MTDLSLTFFHSDVAIVFAILPSKKLTYDKVLCGS